MLQKKSFKKSFLWKNQNDHKGSFVVESFVTIGSFDWNCTSMHLKLD